MTALTDTVDLLVGLGIDPQKLEYETRLSGVPIITVTFRTVADLEAWCAVEKVKITKTHKFLLQHDQYSALYDRPDRRMLAICRVFDHQKPRPEGHANQGTRP